MAYLIYCTPDGEIREEPRLQALAFGDRPLLYLCLMVLLSL